MPERPITTAEALAATVCTTLTATIVVGYLWGRVAIIAPSGMLAVTIGTGVGTGAYLLGASRSSAAHAQLLAAVVVFAVAALGLAYLAWPTLLLTGRGPDLTHHLMLVDFLERNWRLPDASLVPVMLEMAHYTPGVHLLAALVGAWTRSDGFHTIYSVVALTVALKCAFIFLIATRVLPSNGTRIPLALAAVVLCALPAAYFIGSFVHDSFLAQAVAELFAVAMWWAIVVWDVHPRPLPAVLFAVAGVGALLTWPMWIAPPIVALAAVVITRDVSAGERIRCLALALIPVVAMAVVHTVGRFGWLSIAGTSGPVLRLSVSAFSAPFLVLAAAGSLVACFERRARATMLLTLSLAVQAVTLYLMARNNASTPYMAFKMMYLLIYPLAVVGALALSTLLTRGNRALPALRASNLQQAASWALLVATAIAVARGPLQRFSHPAMVVSRDLYQAGQWARRQLDTGCVDYLVPNADTMYWLHLAVLGNSRSSLRVANPATFEPHRAIARWIEPGGLPYAVADRSTVPREVLEDIDILAEFGTALVVTRRGPSSCADAQKLAGDVSRKP